MCQMRWGWGGVGIKLSLELQPEDTQYLWKIWPTNASVLFSYPIQLQTACLLPFAYNFLGRFLLAFGLLFALNCCLELWNPDSSALRISEKATRILEICDSSFFQELHTQRHSGESFHQAPIAKPPQHPLQSSCLCLSSLKDQDIREGWGADTWNFSFHQESVLYFITGHQPPVTHTQSFIELYMGTGTQALQLPASFLCQVHPAVTKA